jgi:regulator of replication initiation timing
VQFSDTLCVSQNEISVDAEVQRRFQVLQLECQHRVEDANELAKSIERRLLSTEEALQLSQQQCDRAQSQVFEISMQAEQRWSALKTEHDLLTENLQSIQFRNAELDSELEDLRSRVSAENSGQVSPSRKNHSSAPSGAAAHATNSNATLTLQLEALETIVSQLRSESRTFQESLLSERIRYEALLREQSAVIAKEKESADKIRQELADRPSRTEYITLRRRLQIVQKIAFHSSSVDDEDDNDGAVATNGGEKVRSLFST